MRTYKIDLDLDFIGGQGSLTKIEEKELSNFFKSQKLSARTTIRQKVVTTFRPNSVGEF
jgi:hypothetical protein